MTRKTDIDIAVQSALWPELSELIEKAARAAIDNMDEEATLSIVLADDAFIQDLNKRYRNKNKPTNVLSFPQDHPDILGDIVLAYETIQKEAEQQNKTFEDHVTHLVVHGTLHLLGLDHETDSEAEEMESLEIRILASLGVKNPYDFENPVTY